MEHIKSMSRLSKVFTSERNKVLSVFYTAGFPHLHDTVEIGKQLAKAGADIIEIGIPFSDPIADGPTIQASNKVALDNGMNLTLLLEQVTSLRKQVEIPILLMGYLNPVMQYGWTHFLRDAAAAGVDGLILPDLPLDEFEADLKPQLEAAELDMVFLITPTTPEARVRRIDAASSGFVYAVSASSTTGAKTSFSEVQENYFKRIQEMQLHNPVLIGFGISNAATFHQACNYAQGAIVGSAFINLLSASDNLEADIKKFVSEIKSLV
ncbi:MAG TPA: tryptophan synthase subunit alpha [Cyclobacteriaceae bacterium]|nr:tryptophan synthase subunit alpha [Cyclobacteriaceae bacterium]